MTARQPAQMPALFVGHGSPMNAIETNRYSLGWRDVAARLPRPRAVLCVSAHWETRGVVVSGATMPETIHDFYGFPDELFAVRYPAPGDPALTRDVARLLGAHDARVDPSRGLDHGAWSVLRAMYPDADVPVVQLSIDTAKPGTWHVELAKNLAPLRTEGVLVLGSGNLVHNLPAMDWSRPDGFDWADRFDADVRQRVAAGDVDALATYEKLGPDARRAVPTPEHYVPLLYALALRRPEEPVAFFNEGSTFGSISMTSFVVGG